MALKELPKGLSYCWRGFYFLKSHRSLWPYAIAPVVVNIFCFALMGYLGYHYGTELYQRWLPAQEGWFFQALGWLARVLVVLIILILVFFTFTFVGTVISAPFNDLLSQKTERIIHKNHEQALGLVRNVVNFFRALWEALRLLVFKLLVTLAVLPFMLLNFIIPLVGSIPSILVMVYFMAFDFLDLPLARRNLTLKEKRHILRKHRGLTMGFGLAVYIMMMVPLAQLLVLPVATVGATILCLEAGLVELGAPD